MHFVFIPYGIKSAVDRLMIDIQAQKHIRRIYKDGKEVSAIWETGALRLLPFGVWEYICPREDADKVMTTLGFDNPHKQVESGFFTKTALTFIRKALKCDKIPTFDNSKKLLWITQDVAMIPIGVRYDKDKVYNEGEFKGCSIEML